MECVPAFYDIIRKYFNFFLLCADLNLFRSNFLTTVFVAIPVHLLFSGVNQDKQMKEKLFYCPEDNFPKLFLKLILSSQVMVPFIYSFYMQTLNEQRLFLWGENNGKQ